VSRLGTAGLVVVAVAVSAGCGGSKPKPLGLEQRVLEKGDLAGFRCYAAVPAKARARARANNIPLPPRCRRTLSNLKALADIGGAFINDPRAARKRLQLQKAGILRGFGEQLFTSAPFSRSPKGPPKTRPNTAASLVVQFKSVKDAQTFLTKLYPESFAPCPEKCQVVKTPFRVSGIKGAKGAELSLTVGPVLARFRAYRIEFADGPFLYGLAVYEPASQTNAPSENDVVNAAQALYERVKHRPPPGS
jgi:hypothetical protein